MICWIASYPRSGNTFVRTIINRCYGFNTKSIYNDIGDIHKIKELNSLTGAEQFTYTEASLENLRKDSRWHFIKTHEQSFSTDSDDAILYLVRDGRDATVSYAQYLRDFQNVQLSYKDIIYGNPLGFTWEQHVRSFVENNRTKVITLKFEEFTIDPLLVCKALKQLTGYKQKTSDIPTFGELKCINSDFFTSGRTKEYLTAFDKSDLNYFMYLNRDALRFCGYNDKELLTTDDIKNCEFDHIKCQLKTQNGQIQQLLKQTHLHMLEIQRLAKDCGAK